MLLALLFTNIVLSAGRPTECDRPTWRVRVAFERMDDSIAVREYLTCSRLEADLLTAEIDAHGFWLEDERVRHIASGALRQIDVSELR